MLDYIYMDQIAIGSKPKLLSKPTILLSMAKASDRRLIRNNMPEHFTIVEGPYASTSELEYDLCITDLPSFKKHREELLERKTKAQPVYLPLILLVKNSKALKFDPDIWTQVDDVIEIPVPMNMLSMRIKNQMRSRKHSLQIAKKNEKLRVLEKAVNSTDVGIILTDQQAEDQPIIFSNKGFENLTGYSKKEILNRNCRFLQNDDRDQDAIQHIQDCINKGEKGRTILRNYKKDGSMFWNELSVAPIKDPQGNVTHFIGIQNDITELIETQHKLKEERNLHQLITRYSTDMISRHSLDGTYLYVTPSSNDILGYTPEELIGTKGADYFHPDDTERVMERHIEMIKTKKPITVPLRIRTKSGEYKWMELKSVLSQNPENGTDIEIQSTTRDISERKMYEDELEASLHEKSVLLQEIHHRVKNNLAVISGLLQIQQLETNDEVLYKILGNSVSRIKSMALIHEKLYKSKSLSHLEFKEYIEDLVSSIKKAQDYNNKISIQVNCDNTKLNVNQAVPCALILNEAISNAIEHAFINREEGAIWVNLNEKDGQLHISVKDDGIGIPDSVLQHRATSMGMTIIQTLIKQLNAKHEINNDNGTELMFSFTRQDLKGAHNRFM